VVGAVEHKLFVGSLNKQALEKEIEEIFSPYGRVDDVYIMRDEQKQSRGLYLCPFLAFRILIAKFPNQLKMGLLYSR
jgi:RNA recognition motif-containing protein